MSEEKKIIKLELPESLEKPVEALTMPVAENAGTTIGDLWFLAFGWIGQVASMKKAKYAVELEAYKQALNKKLKEIPEERRIEPNTQVVLNALSDSQSCVEEETLREMFANLIASACDADKAETVHPAFPGIIKQMSPNDAALLQLFSEYEERPIVAIRLKYRDSFYDLYPNLFHEDTTRYPPEMQDAVVSCLSMLGLVEVDFSAHFKKESFYEPFLQSEAYKDGERLLEMQRKKGRDVQCVELEKGQIRLTAFGERFLDVCT